MKKTIMVMFALLLGVSLTGCTQKESAPPIIINNPPRQRPDVIIVPGRPVPPPHNPNIHIDINAGRQGFHCCPGCGVWVVIGGSHHCPGHPHHGPHHHK